MTDRLVFFMDDLGTRTICKGATSDSSPLHEFTFALGGLIVKSEDVSSIAKVVRDFCARWDVPSLHGNKIRSRKGKFSFLDDDADVRLRFFQDVEDTLIDSRAIAHACVICRPGYRDRYSSKYHEGTRWEMSKTAFDISVERAAKLAEKMGRKLDVVFERSGKTEDRRMIGYFQSLKSSGTGFCSVTSSRYAPLEQTRLTLTLNSIRGDGKSNDLLQLADLYLHPICHIVMGKNNRAHESLLRRGMLIDQFSEDPNISVKYSCFDGKYGARFMSQKHTRDPEGSLEAVGVEPDPVA